MRYSRMYLLAMLGVLGQPLVTAASDKNATSDAEIRYDPAAMVRISGPIQDVREVAEPVALKGVHVTLAEQNATYDVYIGPAGFLKSFGIALAKRAVT